MTCFKYPSLAHVRRHGPAGYKNYQSYKPWLRDEFVFRCAYCLTREVWSSSSSDCFSTDHFVPQVLKPDLSCDYDNLIFACIRCNSAKREHEIIDPCKEALSDHLEVEEDGSINAKTAEGSKLIEKLRLDDAELTRYRSMMIRTIDALRKSSDDGAPELLNQWLGFPSDLPNLATMRPPKGNARPEGAKNCYFIQKQNGTLAKEY
jgi:5-methylcytosine-specific restriction endonuclease McrA